MKSSLAVLWTLTVLGTCAVAQDKGFGLGILLGEPSGLSGKMWVSQVNAIDAGLAWSFKNSGFLHIHADYLWHFPDVISSSERLVISAGLGGRLGTGHDAVLGVRIPFALAWWPRGVPIDLFLELAPGLDLLPATEFEMQGGIGIRWFF